MSKTITSSSNGAETDAEGEYLLNLTFINFFSL